MFGEMMLTDTKPPAININFLVVGVDIPAISVLYNSLIYCIDYWHFVYNYLMYILFNQNIRNTLRNTDLWNMSMILSSSFVGVHNSLL